MGSYLNIHLNLFPIYVLLLLLTLSHGRPSAKVRETGGTLTAHRQVFRNNKWYQLRNLDGGININSLADEFSSSGANGQPISLMDQQVNGIPAITGPKRESTGNGGDAGRVAVQDSDAYYPQQEETTTAGGKSIEESRKVTKSKRLTTGYSPPAEQQLSKGNATSKWLFVPELTGSESIKLVNGSNANNNMGNRGVMEYQSAPNNIIGNGEFHVEDETNRDSNLVADDQQLNVFRENILKSLGSYEDTFDTSQSSNVSLNNNDMDSLAKVNKFMIMKK